MHQYNTLFFPPRPHVKLEETSDLRGSSRKESLRSKALRWRKRGPSGDHVLNFFTWNAEIYKNLEINY
jgi:hypothetical protein